MSSQAGCMPATRATKREKKERARREGAKMEGKGGRERRWSRKDQDGRWARWASSIRPIPETWPASPGIDKTGALDLLLISLFPSGRLWNSRHKDEVEKGKWVEGLGQGEGEREKWSRPSSISISPRPGCRRYKYDVLAAVARKIPPAAVSSPLACSAAP
ncbi:hypothetical protein PoB_000378000 [Plakobranchus ocellatus]|uniref:Uncharacterized protein n=1 Tax=Plakobranchus ocellatus TaxID=259542 RepID=A0AAV3Y3P2_9GAST|nr:hypothetical protein PoB_000378000 [Plakobranchus ocellatus]